MKFVQSERSFNTSNHSQRVTRSSLGSVNKAKSKNNITKSTCNNNKNSKKLVKSGPTLSDLIPLDDLGSKRHKTRSSLEGMTGSSLKKAKIVIEPEHKSSRQGVKKQIPSQQQKDLAMSKSLRPLRSSLLVYEIDSLTSIPQSSVKGNKSKPAVLNKKPDVVVSSVPKTTKHQKSKSNLVEKNSTVLKDQTRVTRSSLGNAADSLPVLERRKPNSSSESKDAEKQVKAKKQIAKEKVQMINERPKRNTRSSLASADITSDPLRDESPKRKSPTKQVVLPKHGKQIKNKPSPEEKNLDGSKRNTRSSLATADITSDSFRNESPKRKSPIKPVASPKRVNQIKKKTIPEEKNVDGGTTRLRRSSLKNTANSLLSTEDSSESISVVSPSTKSSPRKTGSRQISEDRASVKRVSRSSRRLSTNVVSPALEPTEVTHKEKVAVKDTMKRNARLSTTVLSTPVASGSETRKRSASTKMTSAPNKEIKKTVPTKMPRGVKRKNNTPVAEKSKRMRKSPSTTTPASTKDKTSPKSKRMRKSTSTTTKDPITKTSPLTSENLKKHTRRHTVDVFPKNKKVPSTQQKGRKKSSAVKRTNTVSSRSTPDISILPIDSISTFTTKRPKSAPAAMKKSLPKDPNAIPRKGTLKRKRWLANALKEKNQSYEDDIFENHKFATPFRIPHEADDESDTSIATPKFGFFLTPAVAKRTPKFKDIISPSNLVKARKNAEEYLYRRQNRNKTNKIITLKTPASALTKASGNLGQIPEKKKLEFVDAVDKINTMNKNIEARAREESDEEDKDDYLSDISV